MRKIIIIVLSCFAVIAAGCGVVYLLFLSPINVIINGNEVSLPRETTVSDLQNQGYLVAGPGDMLAIDGTIFEEDAGKPPTVFINGVLTHNLNTEIVADDVIAEERGIDVTEDSIPSEQTIPIQTVLEAGSDFNFYSSRLQMVLDPGREGLEAVNIGVLSGVVMHSHVIEEMSPRVYGGRSPSFGEGLKVVAFTYDDGPHPVYTQQILDVLAKYGIKATFFMLGTSVESNPDIALRVAQAGHQVASHSYSHASQHYLNNLSAEDAADQISTAYSVIFDATGVEARTLRPPGGNLNATGALAGTPWVNAYVGWSIDPYDYQAPGVQELVDRVANRVFSGSIVLLHDGGGNRTQTVEASDILIRKLLNEGYTFVTIDELIALMG